ncbi:indole-3-acetic acid-induced protein ARG7-like [Momordica charantia]|uniref:Indole-3-acetic acid-induced protein ARG7-like n=1 Tax=Momordica charantia TaxID=3673 RepID=A0A6J1CAN3_MOMCH|nr:indole-3-acetic acid-induced protein ARG7-like [Momordica charantia]
MEGMKKKLSKYVSFKGLARTRSVDPMARKSRSWNSGSKYKHPVAPYGCFAVYVGPDKQRFVVRTEFANHPLFQMLLEDAELEYGYNSQGPILLPCEVGLFYQVLAEMDAGDDRLGDGGHWTSGDGGGLITCSPLRLTTCASRQAGYSLLSPSSMLKLNGL